MMKDLFEIYRWQPKAAFTGIDIWTKILQK